MAKAGKLIAANNNKRNMHLEDVKMLNIKVLPKPLLKPFWLILFSIGFSTLLSGCLVDKKNVPTVASTTNFLRIYQDGDFIDYDVTAVTSTTDSTITQIGTMRVQWESTAELADPIESNITHPVVKETTTLTYDGSTDPDVTVVRYISQINAGTDKGSMLLHAIGGGLELYWLYDLTTPENTSSPVIAPVIFDSPMTVGVTPPNTPLNYSVMDGCASGLCGTRFYNFNDNFSVIGDTTEVSTSLGVFTNPIQLSFNGGILPKGTLALSVLGDIRNACGDSNDTISHNGEIFVVPEIGIIQITNICRVISGSGGDVNYTMTVRDTNIPLT